jgi:ABC-type phosphate transport system auxiliary subunit
VRALEAEVSDLQKRRDRTHKRLDSLIADLDRLESGLGDSSGASASASKRAPKRKTARPPR